MVGIRVSFWEGLFSGAMLVLGRVYIYYIQTYTVTSTPMSEFYHFNSFHWHHGRGDTVQYLPHLWYTISFPCHQVHKYRLFTHLFTRFNGDVSSCFPPQTSRWAPMAPSRLGETSGNKWRQMSPRFWVSSGGGVSTFFRTLKCPKRQQIWAKFPKWWWF